MVEMQTKTYLLMALNTILWTGMILMSAALFSDFLLGDRYTAFWFRLLSFYFLLPLLFIGLSLAQPLLRKIISNKKIGDRALVATLLLLPLYLMVYASGI